MTTCDGCICYLLMSAAINPGLNGESRQRWEREALRRCDDMKRDGACQTLHLVPNAPRILMIEGAEN